MGKLKEQMLLEMEVRNFSPKTIKAYLNYMVGFIRHFGLSPDSLGETEILEYLHYLLKVKRRGFSTVNGAYCALKFFYTAVLRRQWKVEKLPLPRGSKRLPVVLARSEVKAILNSVSNLKHRFFLMTTYSAGLRISETANLKLTDIDSKRMQIRVEQGKGKKDRYTLLSETLLNHLRTYWRLYRPGIWLFPGKTPTKRIEVSTIQRAFKLAKKKPASANLLLSIL